ncbi:MAG: hypothetical protein L0220_09700 [Acidobacteria bacterium]|nr:hypothetical protein [Acidobacteriota bacterium]
MSKTRITLLLTAFFSLLTLSTTVTAVYSLNNSQGGKEASLIEGEWEITMTEEGKDPKGSFFEFPFPMSLRLEGKNPVGSIRFPNIVMTDNGPKQEGVTEKVLLDAKFDGRMISFRIEGDEKDEFLEMILELSGVNFIGRWKILNSDEGGSARMSRKPSSKTSPREQIIGEWVVILYADDGTEGDRGTLIVKADGDRLTAKTIFNIDGQKKEWKLIDPKFEGETFLFKVDNGEEVLTGTPKLNIDHFEGPWKASRSGVSGKMKLIRKK